MSLRLLNTAIFTALELSINNILKLDRQALNKIQSLAGSVLAINSTAPDFSFSVTLHQQGVYLSTQNDAPADVTINGTASALLTLLISTKDKQSFYAKDLNLDGNLELLQDIQGIFSRINIDWEFFLSKFVGDIPTQAVSDSIHSVKNLIQNSQHSLTMNLDEYIHQEKKLFPDKQELNNFYEAIDELRLRLDRTEARLTLLTGKLSN